MTGNRHRTFSSSSSSSVTILNVAEKPSVARALASVFQQMSNGNDNATTGTATSRNPSYRSQTSDERPFRSAAPLFTSHNVCFPNIFSQAVALGPSSRSNNHTQQLRESYRPHTMITTSVRGHLATQDFPKQYGWNQCHPSALFHAPIETTYSADMIPLKEMLEQQSESVDAIILWLDCDREGEAIAWEVQQVCLGEEENNNGEVMNVNSTSSSSNGRRRRSRVLTPDRVYRAQFSTVLPQEIQRALHNLTRINMNFVNAVQARSEHDLRVGAAFTRFQTMRLQKLFDEFALGGGGGAMQVQHQEQQQQQQQHQGVVSYGPCQFPTLGFVVERWARIETFVPEDFWYLEMSLQHDGSRNLFLKWKRDRLYDRVLTMALYESCLDAQQATVIDLTGRPKNKWRPVPLATVELQKRASRYLRIGSERLMTAAEELYHAGLISYPRTETEKFRPEFQHIPLIQSFQALEGGLGDYASKLLSGNHFQIPRAGRNDDAAHPPITPCKAVDPNSIADGTQRDVYVLIVKHYLACCSRDAVGKETVLTVKMASEEFTAKGLMVLERNWLEIYSPWERWSTGQGEIPALQVGSRFTPTTLLMKDGRTTPPNPISEVELISLMDRNGIGTDATIAQHISTIQERKYAEKDANQRFLPTKLGIALVEGYNSMGYQLNRPDLRREMEAECNAVAAGRKRKEEIMGPMLAKMQECFNHVVAEARKLDEAVARHYTRLGTNHANYTILERDFSICGDCNGKTSLKALSINRNNRARVNHQVTPKFIFCSTCSMGLKLPSKGIPSPFVSSPANNDPVKCPICHYQVIKINQGDGYTGNGYHLCPKCFTDPPEEYGGSLTGGDFRCFQCSHSNCSLAGGTEGGDVEIMPCPFCGGKVCLKKNSRGYILSCSNYRTTRCEFTVWLPKEASSISVLDDSDDNMMCPRCLASGKQVKKLKFTWKTGSVPPGYGRQYVACVLCDQTLKTDFRVSIPQINQVQIRARAATGSTAGQARRNNASRGNNGNNARGTNYNTTRVTNNNSRGNSNNVNSSTICFRCRQPGHFASNCPVRD